MKCRIQQQQQQQQEEEQQEQEAEECLLIHIYIFTGILFYFVFHVLIHNTHAIYENTHSNT